MRVNSFDYMRVALPTPLPGEMISIPIGKAFQKGRKEVKKKRKEEGKEEKQRGKKEKRKNKKI